MLFGMGGLLALQVVITAICCGFYRCEYSFCPHYVSGRPPALDFSRNLIRRTVQVGRDNIDYLGRSIVLVASPGASLIVMGGCIKSSGVRGMPQMT